MTGPAQEGYIPVPGGRVWYKIVGSRDAVPLLALHGGPGAGHDYLEPLQALQTDRPVVFYDQLGCGRSDKPNDSALWHIDRFSDEVEAVRRELGLERVHLLGQSWGGWLAIEYMMRAPSGISSLILASTSASVPQWARETAFLTTTLSEAAQEAIRRCEATGDFEDPEYEDALMEFLKRYVCRVDPWPEPLVRSLNSLRNNPVSYQSYVTLQGPSEFTISGNLRDWDRAGRLHEITVPTLLMFGRYDEATPACAETLRTGIRNSKLHVFEQSAHMAHLEETDEFLRVLRTFLRGVEAK